MMMAISCNDISVIRVMAIRYNDIHVIRVMNYTVGEMTLV